MVPRFKLLHLMLAFTLAAVVLFAISEPIRERYKLSRIQTNGATLSEGTAWILPKASRLQGHNVVVFPNRLDFQSNRPSHDEFLEVLACANSIPDLAIIVTSDKLTDATLSQLHNFTNIRSLTLQSNSVTSDGVLTLAMVKNLVCIELRGDAIDAKAAQVISQLPELEAARFAGSKFKPTDALILTELYKNCEIEVSGN